MRSNLMVVIFIFAVAPIFALAQEEAADVIKEEIRFDNSKPAFPNTTVAYLVGF